MPQSLIGALSLALALLVLPSGSRSQTSSSCSDVTTTQCLGTIVPFPEYNEAFPVIEYCLHHTRGFIATTRDNCLETGAGNWTTRPDWLGLNSTLEDNYNCLVCRALNDSWKAPSESQVWLLNLANKTVIKPTDFTSWGEALKSKIEQVVVAPSGRRYLYVLGTYTSVQALKKKYPKIFLLTQPVPSDLKISPRLWNPQLLQTNETIDIKVKTLITARSGSSMRAMDQEHDKGFETVRSIANNNVQAWCLEANCTVTAEGKGTYAIANVESSLTFDLALNVSSSLATVYLVDVKSKFVPLNAGAAVLTQSGTNASMGGAATLWTSGGLNGNNIVVGVGDTGLDFLSCFFHDPNYPVTFQTQYNSDLGGNFRMFSSTGHRKIREYYGYADSREGRNGGHGTHVCGTVAGYPAQMAAASSAYKYQGMAFRSKLAFFDIGSATDGMLYLPSDLSAAYFPRAYAVGARVHSNSWGSDYNGNSDEMYQSDYYQYFNQDFLILYAAGNAGNDSYSVGNPAVAKNSLAVGATDNYKGKPDVSGFSSRGPTYDFRFKPDITAPGDPVWSAYSMATGTANQCYIVSMSGTSMATPAVAGNAALLVEYFTKGFYPLGYANADHVIKPMGALVKAMIINSGQQMTGKEATKHNSVTVTFPNWDQGFGHMALKYSAYLVGDDISPNMLYVDGAWDTDCASCPTFTATGTKKYYFTPTKSTSLRITLVWHDYPAASTVTTKALVNDLDLTAKQGLITYYANGQLSTAGYNALNNVEQITIANPVVGSTVTVTVTAYSLATSQPYSLVVTGNFKKDYRNFNKAIPQVNVIATDGAQALFVGKNLPASAKFNYTLNMTCVSDPSVKIKATVLQYSTAATYLAATLSTTACEQYRVKVISDNFIGNRSAVLEYGSVNVSTYCDKIAYDQTCWMLRACTGKCKLPGGDKKGKGFDLLTIIVFAVVFVAILLLCCAGGYCIYHCCCRRKRARRPVPVKPHVQTLRIHTPPQSYDYPGPPSAKARPPNMGSSGSFNGRSTNRQSSHHSPLHSPRHSPRNSPRNSPRPSAHLA